jgi:hypothetical protein
MKQTFYMCGVAYDHELGNTDVTLYPTLKALRESMKSPKHIKQCGLPRRPEPFAAIESALVGALILNREAEEADPFIDDYPTQRLINAGVRKDKLINLSACLRRALAIADRA